MNGNRNSNIFYVKIHRCQFDVDVIIDPKSRWTRESPECGEDLTQQGTKKRQLDTDM